MVRRRRRRRRRLLATPPRRAAAEAEAARATIRARRDDHEGSRTGNGLITVTYTLPVVDDTSSGDDTADHRDTGHERLVPSDVSITWDVQDPDSPSRRRTAATPFR